MSGGTVKAPIFPRSDEPKIRLLLREKVKATRDRQKRIRGELRDRFGFYITIFGRSNVQFTEADLDKQIKRGNIVFK